MSTGNENLDLLIKLLGMTTSDNDNVALVAIRKANLQLDKFGATWESILKGRVTVVQDPFASVAPRTTPSSAPPPAARRSPPPPRPQPAPQPQRIQDLFLLTPSGEYIGPFVDRPEAVAYRSRLNIAAVTQQAAPNVFHTPRQYETIITSQRARRAAAASQPKPQPSLNTGFGSRQVNRFAGKCWSCARDVAAGEGFLATQDTTGKWRIECGSNKGHNASYANRSKRPAASASDLEDLF